MKFSVAVLCFALLLASSTLARDYDLEVKVGETQFNSVFVLKDSATSRYTGTVSYSGEGDEPCSWTFCATRSFRGIITEHTSDGDVDRLLTEDEGCQLIHEGTYNSTENATYGNTIPTDAFNWNAEGEFYLNGQLTSGKCAVTLIVTGAECQDDGEFGFECLPYESYRTPNATEELSAAGNPLVFAEHLDEGRFGQLKMVVDVLDEDSDGLPSHDLGVVRLLLNGIPTEEDYDFEVPLVAPETELTISAARSSSTYFYSVKAHEDVTVRVEHVSVMDCEYLPTYGPNCSITANTLGKEDMGEVMTISPADVNYCSGEYCYFSLVEKRVLVTVKPVEADDKLAIMYKSDNFPTEHDFDVAMPGSTSFVPDVIQTEPIAHFAVYTEDAKPFTILLGKSPIPPPPPPPPAEDELPWAWIGVAIALGVISLALITGFAIYTCKPARTYESIE